MKAALTLHTATDEQLLAELVRRNPPGPAPRTRTTRDFDVLIGIGKNRFVDIQFFQGDLDALRYIDAASAEAKP